MGDAIRYRLATAGDIPDLRVLIPMSVRALSEGFYTPAQVDGALEHHVFGVDSQLIEDGTYLIAEADGQIVGAGGWSKRKTLYGSSEGKTGPDPLLDPSRDPARIRAFFVHPGWARRGIGRHIMQACEDAAREAGFTRMELVATLPGEKLYAVMGFKPVEPVDIPLSGGEILTCIRMDKLIE
ncbi:MAG TPA: GNAT family N-acetyltransferase [Chloroflexia bacterium]|nr:GNAT family N-acetyltransferase [Chloroflexia bacterium]